PFAAREVAAMLPPGPPPMTTTSHERGKVEGQVVIRRPSMRRSRHSIADQLFDATTEFRLCHLPASARVRLSNRLVALYVRKLSAGILPCISETIPGRRF